MGSFSILNKIFPIGRFQSWATRLYPKPQLGDRLSLTVAPFARIYIVSSLLATILKESESEKDTQRYLKFTFCWVWETKLVICKSPNWMTELLFARIYMCHLCYFLFWKSEAAQDNIFQKEAWWSFCVLHSSKLENKWFFTTSIFLPKIGMDGPSPRFRGFWGK